MPQELRQSACLDDPALRRLADYGLKLEAHYGGALDIEWVIDQQGRLYILQARPETVKSQAQGKAEQRYKLKGTGTVLAEGRAIGQKIGTGPVRIVHSLSEMDQVQPGDVLVTDMTDPDWEPVMKRAAAIVTNRGGRTCHAAIIARELGIPAVVGCGDATRTLPDGAEVTVSCADGDTGHVYAGLLPIEIVDVALDRMPPAPTKIMMNVGNPELAFEFQRLPNEGVGLARLEFIINRNVGIHPKALIELDRQPACAQRLCADLRVAAAHLVKVHITTLRDAADQRHALVPGAQPAHEGLPLAFVARGESVGQHQPAGAEQRIRRADHVFFHDAGRGERHDQRRGGGGLRLHPHMRDDGGRESASSGLASTRGRLGRTRIGP